MIRSFEGFADVIGCADTWENRLIWREVFDKYTKDITMTKAEAYELGAEMVAKAAEEAARDTEEA